METEKSAMSTHVDALETAIRNSGRYISSEVKTALDALKKHAGLEPSVDPRQATADASHASNEAENKARDARNAAHDRVVGAMTSNDVGTRAFGPGGEPKA